MSYSAPSLDFCLDVSRGSLPGFATINKFGNAPNGIQTTATDIWTRADSVPTQQIWIAPTQARIHAIVSSSASDDGNPVGVGARTIRVTGLTSWSSAEVSEDITLDGTNPVNTVNSYVIIHRMKVLTSGSTSINVGNITATAATDGTVTAVIEATHGQTEMSIYGVPTTQSLYIKSLYASMNSTVAQDRVDVKLLINENPNVQLTNFISKLDFHLQNSGNSYVRHEYCPYLKVAGPAIIKMQGLGSSADIDCGAGFDGILINN